MPLNVTEIAWLYAQITEASSHKAQPVVHNIKLMGAGKQTEVSMAIAIALGYQIKNGEA